MRHVKPTTQFAAEKLIHEIQEDILTALEGTKERTREELKERREELKELIALIEKLERIKAK